MNPTSNFFLENSFLWWVAFAVIVLFGSKSLLFAANVEQTGSVSSLKGDEELIFFPTFATKDGAGVWHVPVHGWVFEPEHNSVSRRALLGSFARSLRLSKEDEEGRYFRERAGFFLVDNEGGKHISVRFNSNNFPLERSGKNGHLTTLLQISPDESFAPNQRTLEFETVLPPTDTRSFKGQVHLLPDEGMSVITDIDDTIKVSEVTNRRALLENTFLRKFEAVVGMADIYQKWEKDGAFFHYVTASPWQLYPALAEFLKANSFPEGSMEMRYFRWKDESFFNLFSAPSVLKQTAIEPLLAAFPKRKFILVGDTGELDPEIYQGIANKYPGQVSHIFIRYLVEEEIKQDRFEKIRSTLPPQTQFHLFRDGLALMNQSLHAQ